MPTVPTKSITEALTEELESNIQRRNSAQEDVEEIQNEINTLTNDIGTAKDKLAQLRSDDSRDIVSLGSEIAQQSSIMDVGNSRLLRLKLKLKGAQERAGSLAVEFRQILPHLAGLPSFRQVGRAHKFAKSVAAWIDVEKLKRYPGRFEKALSDIYDMASFDREVVLPDFVTAEQCLAYIRLHQEEIENMFADKLEREALQAGAESDAARRRLDIERNYTMPWRMLADDFVTSRGSA